MSIRRTAKFYLQRKHLYPTPLGRNRFETARLHSHNRPVDAPLPRVASPDTSVRTVAWPR